MDQAALLPPATKITAIIPQLLAHKAHQFCPATIPHCPQRPRSRQSIEPQPPATTCPSPFCPCRPMAKPSTNVLTHTCPGPVSIPLSIHPTPCCLPPAISSISPSAVDATATAVHSNPNVPVQTTPAKPSAFSDNSSLPPLFKCPLPFVRSIGAGDVWIHYCATSNRGICQFPRICLVIF